MNVKLLRTDYNEFGIFGELSDESGNKFAVTLEHAYPETKALPKEFILYSPKIAAGTYICKRHAPNRLPYETFELQNVPNFQDHHVDGVLIHIGNYNKDSIGCILLGKSKLKLDRGMMITGSKETFQKFMDLQKDVSEFTLTIE